MHYRPQGDGRCLQRVDRALFEPPPSLRRALDDCQGAGVDMRCPRPAPRHTMRGSNPRCTSNPANHAATQAARQTNARVPIRNLTRLPGASVSHTPGPAANRMHARLAAPRANQPDNERASHPKNARASASGSRNGSAAPAPAPLSRRTPTDLVADPSGLAPGAARKGRFGPPAWDSAETPFGRAAPIGQSAP